MSKTSSFTSNLLSQNFLGKFNSRKLLLQNPRSQIPETPTWSPSPNPAGYNSLNSDVVMVFSILICAVICSIIINTFIRCVFMMCASSVADASTSADSSLTRTTANRGVKQKALRTFPVVKYSKELELPGLDSECVICLSDFVNGDRVKLLPKCNHGFHVRCINKWLRSNSSCPKCRHCLNEICGKIVECSSGNSSSAASGTVQESRVNIIPLEHEPIICNL